MFNISIPAPSSSIAAPTTRSGETGAAGPRPPGTPVGKEGWVSWVVNVVVVTVVLGPVVSVEFPLVVVSRVIVLDVVLPPDGEVELPVIVPVPGRDVEVRVLVTVLVAGPVLTVVGPVTDVGGVLVGPVDVPEGGVLELGGDAAQAGAEMTLLSNVTAPVAASSRPVTKALVFAVTDT